MDSFFLTLGFPSHQATQYADAIQATERAEMVDWLRKTIHLNSHEQDMIFKKMSCQDHSGGSLGAALRMAQYVFNNGYESLAADAIHWNNLNIGQIEVVRRVVLELAVKRGDASNSNIRQVALYDRSLNGSLGEGWRSSSSLTEIVLRNAAAAALNVVRTYNLTR